MIFIILLFNKTTAKCQKTVFFLKDFIKSPIYFHSSPYQEEAVSSKEAFHRAGKTSAGVPVQMQV